MNILPDFPRTHNNTPDGWKVAWAGDLVTGSEFVRQVALKASDGFHAGYGFGRRVERLVSNGKTDAGLWAFGPTPVYVRETAPGPAYPAFGA